MIRRVRVSQFKSIGETTSVDLAQLTVVTGANSSGKSTLLQSLLLLAQTVLHAGSDRQLVLNGPLTRLGDFRQVLHQRSSSSIFRIGIEVAPLGNADSTGNRQKRILTQADRPALVSMDCGFTDKALHANSIAETASFPMVSDFHLESQFDIDNENLQKYSLTVRRHRWSAARRAVREELEDLPDGYLDALAWKVELDTFSQLEMKDRENAWPVIGASFNHFLPRALASKTELNRDAGRMLIDHICQRKPSAGQIAQQYFLHGVLWEAIRAELPLDYEGPTPDDDVTAQTLLSWLTKLPLSQRRSIQRSLGQNRDAIADEFAASLEPVYWLDSPSIPSRSGRGLDAVLHELSELRYLGPLRVQPAPIYPVATTLGSQDVGPSGEWTASVLDEYKDAEVTYVAPSSLPLQGPEPTTSTAPLLVAVNQWMAYLGVSSQVKTIDRGSLGHELKVVSASGDQLLPLTHVGVGVSQCLPVVVSLLLATRGSLTLLEQPELHLHPAVQSRLADFLLAMSTTGRQCLVETHSEYLVNRLRLRVAQADDAALADQVAIYFADIGTGSTVFSEIALNEFGAVEHWPPGFFDQTQDDTEAILIAGLAKRRRGHADAGNA